MINTFAHPYMFFLLVPLALVLLRAWFKPVPALRVPSLRPFKAASKGKLSRINLRKLVPFLLYSIGGVMLIVALAGPREGMEEIRRRADGIDIMVALEKMEAVRYAEFLNPNGVAVINDYAIKSTTIASGAEAYPEGCIEAMQKNFKTIAVPASDIAIELGNPKCMNVVLFGAMCDSLGCPEIDWEQVVAETVPAKVKELNLKAFRAGREAAKAAK